MRKQGLEQAERHPRPYGELTLLAGNTSGAMRTHRADLKLIRIRPGASTSLHRHLIAESIYRVLEGSCSFDDGAGHLLPVAIGDTLIVDPGEPHRIVNVGTETLEILEVESPPHDSEDRYPSDQPRHHEQGTRPLGRFWTMAAPVRVKVCGVANMDAAALCLDLGVDAIGVHIVGRHRMERARALSPWLQAVPHELSVFLLTDADDELELLELAKWTSSDTIQLQGSVPPEMVGELAARARQDGLKMVKSIGISDLPLEIASSYLQEIQGQVDALLLDATFQGGSGRMADWDDAQLLRSRVRIPIILAGGLRPSNVAEAIRVVSPFAVDVESGVERRFGPDRGVSARSPELIRSFMRALGR